MMGVRPQAVSMVLFLMTFASWTTMTYEISLDTKSNQSTELINSNTSGSGYVSLAAPKKQKSDKSLNKQKSDKSLNKQKSDKSLNKQNDVANKTKKKVELDSKPSQKIEKQPEWVKTLMNGITKILGPAPADVFTPNKVELMFVADAIAQQYKIRPFCRNVQTFFWETCLKRTTPTWVICWNIFQMGVPEVKDKQFTYSRPDAFDCTQKQVTFKTKEGREFFPEDKRKVQVSTFQCSYIEKNTYAKEFFVFQGLDCDSYYVMSPTKNNAIVEFNMHFTVKFEPIPAVKKAIEKKLAENNKNTGKPTEPIKVENLSDAEKSMLAAVKKRTGDSQKKS